MPKFLSPQKFAQSQLVLLLAGDYKYQCWKDVSSISMSSSKEIFKLKSNNTGKYLADIDTSSAVFYKTEPGTVN